MAPLTPAPAFLSFVARWRNVLVPRQDAAPTIEFGNFWGKNKLL